MKYPFLLIFFLLAGCTSIDPASRRQHADALASAQGWHRLGIDTREFMLAAYVPSAAAPGDTLTVYIEGDGMAWLTRAQASDDPTPRQPLALQLALRHPRGTAVYLARPCQYVDAADQRGCEEGYWTDRRFALQVIEAGMQAIDALKQRYGAAKLVLVGYSGGGAVAALLAARRPDVIRLVTVAGNLDHLAWTTLHGVPPLAGSLNPADEWKTLQHIPQLHFVGDKDTNVTTDTVAAYISRFPSGRRPEMRVISNFNHACCWVEKWPALSSQAFP